jgi:hypothetical protein
MDGLQLFGMFSVMKGLDDGVYRLSLHWFEEDKF